MTKKYVLDTNIISELMRPKMDVKVLEWFDQKANETLYTSSVSVAEIRLGIALLDEGKKKQNLMHIADYVLSEFNQQIFDFNITAAIQYADIVASCSKNGRPICTEDAQIAAISLTNKAILVTRNVKDFEIIDQLQVFNPFK